MKRVTILLLAVFLRVEAATQRTVCASGCQYALNQIQQAVDDAACGDIIQIQAGQNATTNFGLVLRNKGCPQGPYTIIRSSALSQLAPGHRINPATDASKLAKLTSSTGEVVSTERGTGYYRFEGIEITITAGQDPFMITKLFFQIGGGDANNQIADLTHHVQFDRCWIHGTVANHFQFARCVAANTAELSITNSVISDCFNAQKEAQAIAGWNALGPFYFRNNQFSASQIGSLFGGDTPTIRGVRATGSWYLGNYYYRPWTWRGTSGAANPTGTCLFDTNGGEYYTNTSTSHCWRCTSGTWADQGAVACPVTAADKNHLELKNAWGAFIEGNVMQNGFYPAFPGQRGAPFLFNQVDELEPSATVGFVTIQNNVGISTPWVVSVGVLPNLTTYDYPMHDIYIENNLFTKIGAEPQSQGVAIGTNSVVGLQGANTGRFRYSHNTQLFARDNEAFGGSTAHIDGLTDGMEYFGNIVQYGGVAVGQGSGGFINTFTGAGGLEGAIQSAWSTASAVSKNVVVNDKGCRISSNPNAITCPAQNMHSPDSSGRASCPSCAIPRFVENGGTDDVGFVDHAGGDYRLASTSAYKNWSELGRDAGADVEKVNWATAGVAAGTPNLYLDFLIRTLVPRSTTADLRFTAPTTEACVTTVADNWTYTNPVFLNTDAGGDRDRGITVSGLTPDTRYWLKVVCGSAGYRRDDIFVTPFRVTVKPSFSVLFGGETLQLTPTVVGLTDQSVTWSLNPAVGSVNADGLYSAPSSVSVTQTIIVTATSVADPSGFGSVSVILTPGLRQFPIPVFNTGISSTGALLADGSVDPHFRLSNSPDSAFPGPNAMVVNSSGTPIPPWLSNGPKSKWIAPRANQSTGNSAGVYTYRITFDLTGFNPASATLTGVWATDNSGIIKLNGTTLGSAANGFTSTTPFTISSGFVAGMNNLDFIVTNDAPGASPTGVRVELSGTITK